MLTNGYLQIAFYLVVLTALAKPLGAYMARVYEGKPCGLDRVLGPVEDWIYRLTGCEALAPTCGGPLTPRPCCRSRSWACWSSRCSGCRASCR